MKLFKSLFSFFLFASGFASPNTLHFCHQIHPPHSFNNIFGETCEQFFGKDCDNGSYQSGSCYDKNFQIVCRKPPENQDIIWINMADCSNCLEFVPQMATMCDENSQTKLDEAEKENLIIPVTIEASSSSEDELVFPHVFGESYEDSLDSSEIPGERFIIERPFEVAAASFDERSEKSSYDKVCHRIIKSGTFASAWTFRDTCQQYERHWCDKEKFWTGKVKAGPCRNAGYDIGCMKPPHHHIRIWIKKGDCTHCKHKVPGTAHKCLEDLSGADSVAIDTPYDEGIMNVFDYDIDSNVFPIAVHSSSHPDAVDPELRMKNAFEIILERFVGLFKKLLFFI